jgi:hypothetical protein
MYVDLNIIEIDLSVNVIVFTSGHFRGTTASGKINGINNSEGLSGGVMTPVFTSRGNELTKLLRVKRVRTVVAQLQSST